MTYRVELTSDETRPSGGVGIEITAYIGRVPETPAVDVARLTRALRGVWNSRLLYSGDFDSLAEALAAIEAAYPDVADISCTDRPVDGGPAHRRPTGLRHSSIGGSAEGLTARASELMRWTAGADILYKPGRSSAPR